MLQPEWLVSEWQLGGIRILPLTAFVPAMTIVLVGILLYVVYRTKPGLAMRAISKDIETTRLLGVRVDNIIALTFGIGSALAAASGIMWALRYPQVHPTWVSCLAFKAFIAAVFGGIGSIQGAVIGGVALGFVEIMTVAFMPELLVTATPLPLCCWCSCCCSSPLVCLASEWRRKSNAPEQSTLLSIMVMLLFGLVLAGRKFSRRLSDLHRQAHFYQCHSGAFAQSHLRVHRPVFSWACGFYSHWRVCFGPVHSDPRAKEMMWILEPIIWPFLNCSRLLGFCAGWRACGHHFCLYYRRARAAAW